MLDFLVEQEIERKIAQKQKYEKYFHRMACGVTLHLKYKVFFLSKYFIKGKGMKDKYTIEVSDEFVKITGTLTIREAFDFLNFFDREGYGILESDEYGTTLCMRRGNIEEERKAQINKETLENLEEIKKDYKEEKIRNSELAERIKDLEYLVKKVALDGGDKIEALKKANENLQKFKVLENLKNSPEAAKICAMEGPGAESEDLTEYEDVGIFPLGTQMFRGMMGGESEPK